MTVTTRPLVGRETETELLDRRLAEACAGTPRFVVVSGEPGIGKTSLLADLADRAIRRGCLVLQGRATELERDVPFALFVDALDAHLAAREPHDFARLPADELAELAAVFPALRAFAPRAAQPSTATERFLAHHAVRELLGRLAARAPLLLTLDDLHWCDGSSIELLGHLLRRPPDGAILLVGAHRSGREAAVLEPATRGADVERLALGPLGRMDADTLLEDAGAPDRDRLFRDSGGNPFYLLQLARSAPRGAARGNGDGGPVDPHGVPPAVAAAIAGEIDTLGEQERRLIQAAAVAGDPFDLDLAIALGALDEGVALDALDVLVERDLVRACDAAREFRFRHPLVRSAVHASSPPGRRLRAHERAAALLAERGAPASVRAHHVEQSARHGDLEAVAVLREAGAEAAARAPSSAARWLLAALRILPAGSPPAERAELLMPLAIALASTGRLVEAQGALAEVLSLDVEDLSIPRVAVVSACANCEQLLGRRADAHARLIAALEAVDDPRSAPAAALMVSLALDGFIAMDWDAMATWSVRAVDTTRTLDHAPLHAAAMAIHAFALANVGAPDARERCIEAAALVDVLTDEQLAERPDAIAHLCGAEYLLERHDDSIRHGKRGLVIGRASGQGDFFPTLTSALGGSLFLTGRLDEAAEQLTAAVERARLTDNAMALGLALLNRTYNTLVRGELDGALRQGEEAVAVTSDLPDSVTALWASATYAVALHEAGEHERAVAMLTGAAGERLERVPGPMRAVFLGVLAESALALGREELAARRVADAVEAAAVHGLAFSGGCACRSRAALALYRGDTEAARDFALEGIALLDGIDARIEAARLRVLAAQACAAAGDTDEAVTLLEDAVAALEVCGAERYRLNAERELRRLGRSVHRRSRRGASDGKGVAALTGRELEVARLVVDRRTNPEIAGELFLSIKTVESHLRNIFTKLGVSSRVEVARTLEREHTSQPNG
jgi:DNA-binding CsgD family transcriptional regulator